MSTRQRILVILQLCLAFSAILWFAFQPFMGEYFSLRSRMLLYEYAMGTSDLLKKDPSQADKMARNAERFAKLPAEQSAPIIESYRSIQEYAQRPTFTKITDGIRVLLLQIPPFQLAWLVFAAAICVLLLLRTPGAKEAAWILPLVAFVYLIDNQLTGTPPAVQPDRSLFPLESQIIHEYLQEPLDKTIAIQHDQLQKGWENYLVKKWSADGLNRLEEAEFNFTLARLKMIGEQPPSEWFASFHEKSSLGLLTLYFLWNLYFAWAVNRKIDHV